MRKLLGRARQTAAFGRYFYAVIIASIAIAGSANAQVPAFSSNAKLFASQLTQAFSSVCQLSGCSLTGGLGVGGQALLNGGAIVRNGLVTDSLSATGNVTFSGSGYLQIPSGTTAQEPGSPSAGMLRWNSTTSRQETYSGTAWQNHVRLSGDTMLGGLTINAGGLNVIGGNISGLTLAAGSSTARTLSDWLSDVENVVAFGADRTGATDSTSAINAAASATRGGTVAGVYLPAGTYHITNAINIGSGQCLYGDGRGVSTITVGSDFNTTALGAIVLTGREQSGPCVHDLDINFAQPSDQSSRSSFLTLAQGCTTGTGGSGCKYPPAIYNNGANRFLLRNLRIAGAWDGIADPSGGGFWIDDIEMGALDIGMSFDGGNDFCHIKGYHFWNFGISGNLFNNVYGDGGTFAAQMGQCGVNITDFTTFEGRVQVTSTFDRGEIANLMLDGNNSTLEVANNANLLIDGVYATGNSTGSNTHCAIDVSGGTATIVQNVRLRSGAASICLSAGNLRVSGGRVESNNNVTAITQTGGDLEVSGLHFAHNASGAWTVPVVSSAAGALRFVNNYFDAAPATGTPVGVSITTDSISDVVSGNAFNGWLFTTPGPLGFYWPNTVAAADSYYSSPGTYTYIMPAGYGHLRIRGCGWGGPGGSGAVQASNAAASGGAGGGGGLCLDQAFAAAAVSTGVAVTIGSAPTPGAAVTANVSTPAAGNAGAAGGLTTVTSNSIKLMNLYAGGAGAGGQLAAASGGGGNAGTCGAGGSGSGSTAGAAGCGGGTAGVSGGAGNGNSGIFAGSGGGGTSAGVASAGGNATGVFDAGGGASGGGTTSAGGANNGANGGRAVSAGGTSSSGGTSTTPTGQAGIASAVNQAGSGGGGGWGGPTSTANAGAGGAGSQGDAGGGGGSCTAASGTCSSGAGGQGGASFVELIPMP